MRKNGKPWRQKTAESNAESDPAPGLIWTAEYDGVRTWRNRYWLLAAVLVAAFACAVWPIWKRYSLELHLRRRAAWLDRAMAELTVLARQAPPADGASKAPPWNGNKVVRFKEGWAVARLHSEHEEDGIGDLWVLVDHRGRVAYSRRHVCTGEVPGSVGDTRVHEDMEGRPLRLRDAEDFDAYLSAYPEAFWTADRANVLDDSKPYRATFR